MCGMKHISINYILERLPVIFIGDIAGNVVDSTIDFTTEMVHYIVIDNKHFVRTILKTLLKNTSKPKAATASKGFNNLLALMTWLSGKVFNEIENDLRIHAWIKHMVHFFTFHLLHTPLFFKHPFSESKHSQLILHVMAILSGLSSSVTEIIGPC